MRIIKFGGSSVKNSESIIEVINIISTYKEPIAVVCSAMGGVTDELINMSQLAASGQAYKKSFKALKKRHLKTAELLLSKQHFASIKTHIEDNHNYLKNLLKGVKILREISPRTLDHIVSYGERNSNYIISQALQAKAVAVEYLDARKVMITDDAYGNATIDKAQSYPLIRSHFQKNQKTQIVTGFIASDAHGKTTTLGRGGSDYTAALLAEALEAEAIEIWTDVDGILSADPRKVENAYSIDKISYQEAMEMSHFGAKVIYPPTIKPALDKNIPVIIKNTFNPSFPGSVISSENQLTENAVIGISAINDVTLLSLQGSGLFGVPGIAARLFGALATRKVNIILITQGSSEHSITFAISPNDLDRALLAIKETFEHEIKGGYIDEIKVENELSVIAIIGEQMRSTPGIAGKLFQALGVNGINIRAIAQGSSELNISVVINQVEQKKALNVAHEAFFNTDTKDVHLFLVGVGLIGKTLIKQIENQQQILEKNHGIKLNIIGLANSKHMIFNDEGVNLANWENELFQAKQSMNIKSYVDQMIGLNMRNAIFVDNTSAQNIIDEYDNILDHSISISTPNKLAASASMNTFNKLQNISSKRGVAFQYETNVGAGLPVISTLRDLIRSGDEILSIEAVLSGSLSYIFNNFKAGVSFYDIVLDAKQKGLTEPDPRDDLNGYDVRRKILILARECGASIEETDITLKFFLSEKARNATSIDEFMTILRSEDDKMTQYIKGLQAAKKKPRMIARFEQGKASVGVEEVTKDSPFFHLEGSDNMIVFQTRRYNERPLVIKGPGAGADVTAAGVLAEIINIANSL